MISVALDKAYLVTMVMHSDLFAWGVRSPEALRCLDRFAVEMLSQRYLQQGPLKCLYIMQTHN